MGGQQLEAPANLDRRNRNTRFNGKYKPSFFEIPHLPGLTSCSLGEYENAESVFSYPLLRFIDTSFGLLRILSVYDDMLTHINRLTEDGNAKQFFLCEESYFERQFCHKSRRIKMAQVVRHEYVRSIFIEMFESFYGNFYPCRKEDGTRPCYGYEIIDAAGKVEESGHDDEGPGNDGIKNNNKSGNVRSYSHRYKFRLSLFDNNGICEGIADTHTAEVCV